MAAWGIDRSHRFSMAPLADAEFDALLVSCEEHRLMGMLAGAIRDGSLRVNDRQRVAAQDALAKWLVHDLRVERIALEAMSALAASGIEHVVAKGVALAHTRYPDPSQRVFADVDLLVRANSFSAAASVLAARLHVVRSVPELMHGFDDRFGREIMLKGAGVEVDLHRTLVDGPYGHLVDRSDLFEERRSFSLGGHELTTLGTTAQFLHACFSARLGDWPARLMSQRDVVQLARHGDLDAQKVVDMAQRWRAEAVVASAIVEAWSALRLESTHPLLDWATALHIRPFDRLLLSSYRGAGRGYRSHAAAVLVIPGFRERAAYVRAIVRPSRAYLDARGLAQRDRVRRLVHR